ncbi:uncharacterized protein PV09_06042 [Verruconis gallopava]|uniref:Carboxymuconolactone decarboxylase-like domain-containing protein n=1 Tax=Verruconis gallopava TaxID=253628 RepID=A0A0D1YPP8_9PEZI|nr:uncharacterized protein PV09_06042 [Verruconis gallopava]KIW02592.1 hypothetical protein PV09_06042 [Verruconis gallopava]
MSRVPEPHCHLVRTATSSSGAATATDKSDAKTSTASGSESSMKPPPTRLSRAIVTPALLHSLRTHPHLPKHAWYVVTGVTLSALNRPDEIPAVFHEAVGRSAVAEADEEEQLRIVRRMREGLVKSAAVVGLPKTINALMALKSSTPEHLLDTTSSPSPSLRTTDLHEATASEILLRGESFFDRVYGRVSRRVMGQMDRAGTQDLGLIIRLLYGFLLSNTRILSAAETSFVLIAGLVPQDVNPQLKGHLKGALNNSATVPEVRAVRDVALRLCEETGMRMLGSDEPGGWGWREDVASL